MNANEIALIKHVEAQLEVNSSMLTTIKSLNEKVDKMHEMIKVNAQFLDTLGGHVIAMQAEKLT